MLLLQFFCFLSLASDQFSSNQKNNLIYGEGTTLVTTEIDTYENLAANTPITGSVMITHDQKATIDVSSFRLGNTPLKVNFVQSASMSSYNPLVVTIYKFQLPGMKSGAHTLPPIAVKVGGKEYQALPMTIDIP